MDETVRRFAVSDVERLSGRYSRALAGNAAGQAVLIGALERSVELGYDGWCAIDGEPDGEVGRAEELWARWQRQRDFTPEAERWPDRLAKRGDAASERVLEAAATCLVEAGAELGLTAGGHGRGATTVLSDVGRQAAEAGAALWCAFDDPSVEDDDIPAATPSQPAPDPLWGDTVRVATAANIAECELVQDFSRMPAFRARGVGAAGTHPSSWAAATATFTYRSPRQPMPG